MADYRLTLDIPEDDITVWLVANGRATTEDNIELLLDAVHDELLGHIDYVLEYMAEQLREDLEPRRISPLLRFD